MLSSEIFSHLLLTFIYFVLVSLLRGNFDFSLAWLWSGALLGTFLLDIDHLLFWFWLRPQEGESIQARALAKMSNYRGLYTLLIQTHEAHNRLVFHTATFQVILLLLTFYVLTATNNLFGAGLVMAMNLHLLKDEWFDWFKGRREVLSDWLFWQVRGVAMMDYLNLYLAGATIIFLILTVFLI
jgi:hypothetical protein